MNRILYRLVKRLLAKEFVNSQAEKKKYPDVEFIDSEVVMEGQIKRAQFFHDRISKNDFYKEMQCLLEYGMRRYQDMFKEHDEDNLVLYQKYSRKDVCRILNWEKDDSSTMYGYRIKYNTCPIFVTYEKKEDIASSTKYEDQFVDNQIFSWMTRSKVSIDSAESQQLIHARENGLKVYLFIKKSDGEGTDFYYMGKATPIEWAQTTIQNDKGDELPIMNFQLQLEHSVRNDLYDYFTK